MATLESEYSNVGFALAIHPRHLWAGFWNSDVYRHRAKQLDTWSAMFVIVMNLLMVKLKAKLDLYHSDMFFWAVAIITISVAIFQLAWIKLDSPHYLYFRSYFLYFNRLFRLMVFTAAVMNVRSQVGAAAYQESTLNTLMQSSHIPSWAAAVRNVVCVSLAMAPVINSCSSFLPIIPQVILQTAYAGILARWHVPSAMHVLEYPILKEQMQQLCKAFNTALELFHISTTGVSVEAQFADVCTSDAAWVCLTFAVLYVGFFLPIYVTYRVERHMKEAFLFHVAAAQLPPSHGTSTHASPRHRPSNTRSSTTTSTFTPASLASVATSTPTLRNRRTCCSNHSPHSAHTNPASPHTTPPAAQSSSISTHATTSLPLFSHPEDLLSPNPPPAHSHPSQPMSSPHPKAISPPPLSTASHSSHPTQQDCQPHLDQPPNICAHRDNPAAARKPHPADSTDSTTPSYPLTTSTATKYVTCPPPPMPQHQAPPSLRTHPSPAPPSNSATSHPRPTSGSPAHQPHQPLRQSLDQPPLSGLSNNLSPHQTPPDTASQASSGIHSDPADGDDDVVSAAELAEFVWREKLAALRPTPFPHPLDLLVVAACALLAWLLSLKGYWVLQQYHVPL